MDKIQKKTKQFLIKILTSYVYESYSDESELDIQVEKKLFKNFKN